MTSNCIRAIELGPQPLVSECGAVFRRRRRHRSSASATAAAAAALHSAMRRRGGRLMATCRVGCQRGLQMPFKREEGETTEGGSRRRFLFPAAATSCEMKGLKGNTTISFREKSMLGFGAAGTIKYLLTCHEDSYFRGNRHRDLCMIPTFV